MALDLTASTNRLVSFLGLQPIGDDVNLYYDFLLTCATFLFFLITCISVIITCISLYYARKTSIVALNSLKTTQLEQTNNEIKSLEEKSDKMKLHLSNVMSNKYYLSELQENIFETEDENGKPSLHLQFDYEGVCTKLEEMSKDYRNLYFYDFSTGKNSLHVSDLLYYYYCYDFCNYKSLSDVIYEAYDISKTESEKTVNEIGKYEIKINDLFSKKQSLESDLYIKISLLQKIVNRIKTKKEIG